ncbi:50S ribosomal protein L34 [bacterium]|nr:50S ribosomal protein L34 [bacterium]
MMRITKRSRIKRLRKHGFRERMSSRSGRALLSRRRKKGRHRLCVSVTTKGEKKQ